jgi:hypothetical protein
MKLDLEAQLARGNHQRMKACIGVLDRLNAEGIKHRYSFCLPAEALQGIDELSVSPHDVVHQQGTINKLSQCITKDRQAIFCGSSQRNVHQLLMHRGVAGALHGWACSASDNPLCPTLSNFVPPKENLASSRRLTSNRLTGGCTSWQPVWWQNT